MNIISTRRTKQATISAGAIGSCFILPQNGVVEGSIHYSSGTASQQVATAAAMDSHNGNAATSDAPKRPKVLAVNVSNGFGTKIRDVNEDNNDSLPCSPSLQPDSGADVSGCLAGDTALENDTRQLIGCFLRDFVGLTRPRWREDKALSTMRRVVEGVLEKHRYAYNGMVSKLMLDERGDDMSFVSSVAKNLFGDGTTNWGRIASLVAFGAVVCHSLKERNQEHCVELVGQEISTYLLTDQRDWLVKNNSWDGFVEFFRVADPESTVRNTLMAVAGFAGIGATLALLIR